MHEYKHEFIHRFIFECNSLMLMFEMSGFKQVGKMLGCGILNLSWIWICLLFVTVFSHVSGLTCYLCPPTHGRTDQDANIECLALGWEMSCAQDEDRCYSKHDPEIITVEKGCTRSPQCIGATSCCQTSYCNADAQTSKTGYGRPCTDEGRCIQGGNEMICAREDVTDVTKTCLCADDSYKRGSTCKKKSYPDFSCTETRHCYDINSTCVNRRCTCDTGMFSNGTRCSYQTGLGEVCHFDRGCRGQNTVCTDKMCTCKFGYLVVNGTDNCSGCARIFQSLTILISTVFFSFL